MAMAGEVCAVSLLGTFEFRVGARVVELPRAAERLVAFLALQQGSVTRHRVAGVLWPDASEERSLGSLRSALWRLRRSAHDVVDPCDSRLRLAIETDLDITRLCVQSQALHDDRGDEGQAAGRDVDAALFATELLPGWYEDWVLFERERFRQLSLHGLEALSRRHTAAGRHADAVEAAWRAIALEPLRESAHLVLVEAHLAEANICEAVRELRAYTELLAREIGVAPSREFVGRIDSALAGRERPVMARANSG